MEGGISDFGIHRDNKTTKRRRVLLLILVLLFVSFGMGAKLETFSNGFHIIHPLVLSSVCLVGRVKMNKS